VDLDDEGRGERSRLSQLDLSHQMLDNLEPASKIVVVTQSSQVMLITSYLKEQIIKYNL
jgi:hypothetical protein